VPIKNREFRGAIVDFSSSLDRVFRDLLFDPQTSGLFWQGVPLKEAMVTDRLLKGTGMTTASITLIRNRRAAFGTAVSIIHI
jgi:hypothetical protein